MEFWIRLTSFPPWGYAYSCGRVRRLVTLRTDYVDLYLVLFFPLECPSPSSSFGIFLRKLELSFSPFKASKGFRLAHFPYVESFFSPERLKLNLVLEVLHMSVPSTRVVISEGIMLRLFVTYWIREVNSSPISWSFPVLVGALCLVWTPSIWEVGLVSLDDYFCSNSLVSSCFYGSGWWIGWRMYQ